jgi:DNA-directed RNA polymerase specialized sigma24 family protein
VQKSITGRELQLLCREADIAAGRLVRRFRLSSHEREDLRQDLLLDLIARLRFFDPSRGSLQAFVGTVFAHRAARLAGRIRRERMLFAPVSLDQPSPAGEGSTLADSLPEADGYPALLGQAYDGFASAERRIALDRALGHLRPSDLALCADLVERSPGELGQAGGPSRASLYRHIGEIRMRLTAAGLSTAA